MRGDSRPFIVESVLGDRGVEVPVSFFVRSKELQHVLFYSIQRAIPLCLSLLIFPNQVSMATHTSKATESRWLQIRVGRHGTHGTHDTGSKLLEVMSK